jgi:hypothetical protein
VGLRVWRGGGGCRWRAGLQRSFGEGSRVEKKKRGEMRARERIKEVEEGSWMCCGIKKRHGRAGAAAGGWRHAWWLRATATRRGRAGKSQRGRASGGRASWRARWSG